MTSDSPTFVLIPGAGGSAFYWHRLAAELERPGGHLLALSRPVELADRLESYVTGVY